MARKTGSQNHIHKYFRMDNGLWACGFDDCTHFQPRNTSPRPAGLKSICWTCDKPFLMTPYNMQTVQPRCDECTDQFSSMVPVINQKLDDMDEDPVLKSALEKQAAEKAKLKLVPPVEDEPEVEDV